MIELTHSVYSATWAQTSDTEKVNLYAQDRFTFVLYTSNLIDT